MVGNVVYVCISHTPTHPSTAHMPYYLYKRGEKKNIPQTSLRAIGPLPPLTFHRFWFCIVVLYMPGKERTRFFSPIWLLPYVFSYTHQHDTHQSTGSAAPVPSSLLFRVCCFWCRTKQLSHVGFPLSFSVGSIAVCNSLHAFCWGRQFSRIE